MAHKSRTTKQAKHRARAQRHADKRRQKREEARAYSKPTPKSQRRANTVKFPVEWGGLFQSKRKKVA
jgi:hypothetical protein